MLEETKRRMQTALEHLKNELAQIRTGRANTSLVSEIPIDAYNTKMMVKELAQITTPEPTLIIISPWDKAIITNIVGGITKANVGLNPVVDGDIVRITIAPMTSEVREQFIKKMHTILEDYRVQIRQIRHDTRENLQKQKLDGDISEDEEKRLESELQKLHDEFVELIEVTGRAKEEDLRQV
jgi:ribosome recycling factor